MWSINIWPALFSLVSARPNKISSIGRFAAPPGGEAPVAFPATPASHGHAAVARLARAAPRRRYASPCSGDRPARSPQVAALAAVCPARRGGMGYGGSPGRRVAPRSAARVLPIGKSAQRDELCRFWFCSSFFFVRESRWSVFIEFIANDWEFGMANSSG